MRSLTVAAVAVAAALLAGGCGADVSIPTVPTFPSSPSGDDGASGDSASFTIDGGTTMVTQSGRIAISGYGRPFDYAGPLGCRGHYFTADYSEHIRMLFRYGRRRADLIIGTGDAYHFAGPPTVHGRSLTWAHPTPRRAVTVTVRCPLPRAH